LAIIRSERWGIVTFDSFAVIYAEAAQEMIQRAAALLDHRCRRALGGTFHSFAHVILRRYASIIVLLFNFSMLDRYDTEDLVGMIRQEWNPVNTPRDHFNWHRVLRLITKIGPQTSGASSMRRVMNTSVPNSPCLLFIPPKERIPEGWLEKQCIPSPEI
jgi:UvrD/REP helicase N-terminal domain